MSKMARRHQMSNMEDMFTSVSHGSFGELQSYLVNGGIVNLKDGQGSTLLHKAVKENHIEKVELLLRSPGCFIDALDKHHCTALHVAVQKGHNSVLEILLDASANVNTVSDHHTTPLIQAVVTNNIPAVKLILEKSLACDVDMENYYQQSALSLAIFNDSSEICELLLRHGASVKSLYHKNFTVDISRHLCNSIEMMKTFLSYGKDNNLYRHLMTACILKKTDVAEMILKKYENPFESNGFAIVMKKEDAEVYETLAKSIIKSYKLATKCSRNNELLMMMLSFCQSEQSEFQRNHKLRTVSMIRLLVNYGLQIHPQTSVKTCDYDCKCRKAIFTALHKLHSVTSLKGQSCSVIRQNLISGSTNFTTESVNSLPLPKILQEYICMTDW